MEGGFNRGYGGALHQGALRAHELGAEWVLFIDSDLTNPPEQIGDFLVAAESEFDIVKACRYCPGGSTGDVPFKRVIISRVGNVLARVLTGVPHADLTNGFRAFRTEPYLELDLHERGFSVILEEIYWARVNGLRVGSLPSTLRVRSDELRPSAFRYTARQLWAYLRWPLRTAAVRPQLFIARHS